MMTYKLNEPGQTDLILFVIRVHQWVCACRITSLYM